ncbi:MAG: serine hydrolase [Synergistaceae bacterium]|nr:serine hydrolase [Synergistaceae bacterium]MBP9625878.1 serine hydrolase [Synergistaceae bacterium]MBP9957786.1 serine hydrolase [Synergistaceae bacterium]
MNSKINGFSEKAIENVIASARGNVSVYFKDISSGWTFEHEASSKIPSASLIKVPILLHLLMEAASGRIDMQEIVTIKPCNRVAGTGVLDGFPENVALPWETLARLMIILSDNCATNEILDKVGISGVQGFIDSMGLKETSIERKMMDFTAIKEGKNNYTSVRDMGTLFAALADGKWGEDFSQKTFRILKRQQMRHLLPLLIPAVPSDKNAESIFLPPSGMVLVGNKTGDLTDKLHDVGWFILPDGRSYVLAIMTYNLPMLSDGLPTISEISRLIYKSMC